MNLENHSSTSSECFSHIPVQRSRSEGSPVVVLMSLIGIKRDVARSESSVERFRAVLESHSLKVGKLLNHC